MDISTLYNKPKKVSHTFINLLSMKNKEIIKILSQSGLKGLIICSNHNDKCNCHNKVRQAA